MKKSIYLVWALLMVLSSCGKDENYPFKDVARVQFTGNASGPEDMTYSFIWLDQKQDRDTVYLPLRVLGGPADIDRELKISQISEFDVEYIKDNKGYIIDSVVTEKTNKAVAGTHYVPFDSPEMKPLLVVKAGEVRDELPIILLRDKSLLQEKMRLRVKLESSADFMLGESKYLGKTIVFSDKMEKPEAWNRYTTPYLGNYSVPKHELMISVVGEKVDDAWLEKGNNDKSFFVFWRGKFVDALNAFNTNPDNIASGKAPMREDPNDLNSPLVTFPVNKI